MPFDKKKDNPPSPATTPQSGGFVGKAGLRITKKIKRKKGKIKSSFVGKAYVL